MKWLPQKIVISDILSFFLLQIINSPLIWLPVNWFPWQKCWVSWVWHFAVTSTTTVLYHFSHVFMFLLAQKLLFVA